MKETLHQRFPRIPINGITSIINTKAACYSKPGSSAQISTLSRKNSSDQIECLRYFAGNKQIPVTGSKIITR